MAGSAYFLGGGATVPDLASFNPGAGELLDIATAAQHCGSTAEQARRQANEILLQIIAVVVVGGVAGGVRGWLFQSAAERVMYRLRIRLFAALLQQASAIFSWGRRRL